MPKAISHFSGRSQSLHSSIECRQLVSSLGRSITSVIYTYVRVVDISFCRHVQAPADVLWSVRVGVMLTTNKWGDTGVSLNVNVIVNQIFIIALIVAGRI